MQFNNELDDTLASLRDKEVRSFGVLSILSENLEVDRRQVFNGIGIQERVMRYGERPSFDNIRVY
jgi:hypothetical protein